MSTIQSTTPTQNSKTNRSGPVSLLLGLFSSVWTGISLALLLFVYCSIGSAAPQIRQLPLIEMTEFQWFHWWPFIMLVTLFCLTMVTVTIRRIPLRTLNAGVWMIHTGMITMTLGSFYYFTTKVEGDAAVFRRHLKIELPNIDYPVRLLALPGNHTDARVDNEVWHFQIQSTNHAWPILSDEHEGETAYAVNVSVTPPSGEPFIRQLLAGYPQYTEDIIPGKGRAIKNIGRKLVDENLSIRFEYEPQTHFHVMDTWAMFVRRVGDIEWIERPIHGLPRYNDHISSRDQVVIDAHDNVPLRALDLLIPSPPGGDALSKATVRVTGYLRYAHMSRQWKEGGDRLFPILSLSLLSNNAPAQTHELIAFDRTRSQTRDGIAQFVWLENSQQLKDLPTHSSPMLHITIPDTDIDLEVPITQAVLAGADAPHTPIEGTPYAYRIRNIHDNLSLDQSRGLVSVAMVDIKTPDGEFTRMVADQPGMSRDMQGDGGDPHGADPRQAQTTDPKIVMSYHPAGAPIILAAHPGGLQLIFNQNDKRVIDKPVQLNQVQEIVQGIGVRVNSFIVNATSEMKPQIIPHSARQRNVKENYSMIKLELNTGTGIESRWLSFNQYALANEDYAYGGRFAYYPERFRLPDGEIVEVLFSRERRALPNAIALDSFELDTHVGGYSGAVSTIRNYESGLRFYQNNAWTDESRLISVNQPTDFGGYWYFQSSWDKPPSNNPSAGMNYTGLGIGNRNGVYIQLFGCCLMAIGMIFAFYVKPVLKRRRAARSRAKIGQPRNEQQQVAVESRSEEALQV